MNNCNGVNNQLPEEFLNRMQGMMTDEEFLAFVSSYGRKRLFSLRLNPLKTDVRKALDLLLPGGVLVLCAYPGHPEGDRERHELTGFFAALSNKTYNVLHQRFLNAGPGAPECFVVQKQI